MRDILQNAVLKSSTLTQHHTLVLHCRKVSILLLQYALAKHRAKTGGVCFIQHCAVKAVVKLYWKTAMNL
jgi:hypothetical protein